MIRYLNRRKWAIAIVLFTGFMLFQMFGGVNKIDRDEPRRGLPIEKAVVPDEVLTKITRAKAVFTPHLPKQVVLLSYQRCGSSFTAQLFNQNPGAFYMFEPLDALYHAMYGPQQGYTVPSDLFVFENGTNRELPEYEIIAVAAMLRSLLNCDLQSIPVEVLMHKFMDIKENMFSSNTKSLQPYIECLLDHNRCNCNPTRQICGKLLKNICPTRFGETYERQLKCFEVLWKGYADMKYFKNSEIDIFFEYKHCMKRTNITIHEHCMGTLNEMCSSRSLHTVKTVRMTMRSAELMLKDNPNLRIIHLVRDPRGVVLSRQHTVSFRGLYSGDDMPKEAKLYCQQAVEDIKHRQIIEERFPGSTLQVVYEDLTQNPMKFAEKIYSFLEEKIPAEVNDWWFDNSKGIVKDSKVIAERWQSKLSYGISKSISDVCSEFYESVDFEWP